MSDGNSSWIKVIPYGGADTVTGSCYHIVADTCGGEKNYLVEAGLFTGKNGRKFVSRNSGFRSGDQ